MIEQSNNCQWNILVYGGNVDIIMFDKFSESFQMKFYRETQLELLVYFPFVQPWTMSIRSSTLIA